MLIPPDELIQDFGVAASAARTAGWQCEMQGEVLLGPHRPPSSLRAGFGAVYAFALRSSSTAPAGGGRVLKGARRDRTAWRGSRRSTTLLGRPDRRSRGASPGTHPVPWLGITAADAASIRSWMTVNLDRLHIFVRQPSPELLTTVELYVRARIGSVRSARYWDAMTAQRIRTHATAGSLSSDYTAPSTRTAVTTWRSPSGLHSEYLT
jgi:hypothetical protein